MPPRRTKTTTPTPVPQVVLLDWRDSRHFKWDAPCVLCRKPTPLRSHADEPAHKTCAESWNAAHPGEVRFVSDPTPKRKGEDDHA